MLAQTSVTTQHNDVARTGANLTETLLTTTNVNVSQFGKLFERTVDDEIYGQPLYVPGLDIPGLGVRNVVFVATNNDSVYAFDADDPAAITPIWMNNYTNPAAGIVPVSRTDVGQACGTYVDFAGRIGIGGTPVIDTASQTIYFVTRTKENGAFVQRLHALDVRDGSARPGSPLVIQASVVGTGDGRDAQNNIAFNSRTHNQRAALLLDRGVVYVAWASYCDQGPYHGWILGYDAGTLQQVMVYNTSPDGGLSGIWQSGGGLTADPAGNIYALTGNGSFNGDTGGRNFGNSFIKISPSGTLVDWFTPYNWSFLNATDEDLGIQNAMLVPNTNLVIGGGKEGVMYVVDRNNMGHVRSGNNGQIVQSFQGSTAARMNGAPVYWNAPTYGPSIYLWAAGDPLKVFRLVNGTFQTPAAAQSTVLAAPGMPGAMLSLSANGNAIGSGILWAAMSRSGDANHTSQPGIVRAYDASNVTRELWNSQQNAGRDGVGLFSKFSPPTIADGKVFVATLSSKLVVYGLLGPTAGNTAPIVDAGADQTIPSPDTVTLTCSVSDDGNPDPPSQVTTTWSLVTGPGPVTFGTPAAATTTATFAVPGVHTIRLSAFDGEVTATDDVVVTVDPPAGSGTGLLAQYFNDAGSGIYFTALALTRTDATVDFDWGAGAPDPSVQLDNFSARWSGQVLAPVTGTYTFTTATDEGVRLYLNGQLLIDNWVDHTLTLNGATASLTAGQRYDIRMDFYERGSLATARLSWSYPGQPTQIVPQWFLYPAPPVNQPPAVNAGGDQTILLPSAATLNGSAADDGLPSPANLAIAWSKISGREDSAGGTVTFANPNSPSTTATFGADGIYVLRLTVSDGAVTVSDDVTITVYPPPIVGTGTGLLGEYFNDPNNGSHFVTYVRGRLDPSVNFDWASSAPATGVTADNFAVRWTGQVLAPVTGNYVFTTVADDGVRLWVNSQLVIDNWIDQAVTARNSAPVALLAGTRYDIRMEYYEHAGLATAKLHWSYPSQAQTAIPQTQLYPPANRAPLVNAGADRTIAMPATTALAGSASDDGLPSPPSQLTTTWSRVSGPGTVTFSNASALNTNATFSAAGTYVLRLTASDSAVTSADDVTIVVTAASGNGLTARYYNDPGTGSRFTTLVLTRVDPTVNFNWGTGSPGTGVTTNNFSVRWTGTVQAPVSGSYRFSTVSDDGIRLWVNGQQLINNWTDHAATTNTSAAISLTAGVKYTITLEFYERGGDAVARLQWTYPGQATQIIPQSRLFQ
ncbi:MAG TPA: PA14 domain-containing protein [Vicinamibacterales bacterium]